MTQLTDVKEPGDLLVCMCRQLEVGLLVGERKSVSKLFNILC